MGQFDQFWAYRRSISYRIEKKNQLWWAKIIDHVCDPILVAISGLPVVKGKFAWARWSFEFRTCIRARFWGEFSSDESFISITSKSRLPKKVKIFISNLLSREARNSPRTLTSLWSLSRRIIFIIPHHASFGWITRSQSQLISSNRIFNHSAPAIYRNIGIFVGWLLHAFWKFFRSDYAHSPAQYPTIFYPHYYLCKAFLNQNNLLFWIIIWYSSCNQFVMILNRSNIDYIISHNEIFVC